MRIGPDELHPTVNKVLRLGPENSGSLSSSSRECSQQYGGSGPGPHRNGAWTRRYSFVTPKRITCADEELIFFLDFGFMDYSGNTSPICSFSPRQQKALLNFTAFTEQVQEEIQKGWIGPAQWLISTWGKLISVKILTLVR